MAERRILGTLEGILGEAMFLAYFGLNVGVRIHSSFGEVEGLGPFRAL